MNNQLYDPWDDAALLAERGQSLRYRLVIVLGADWCSKCQAFKALFEQRAQHTRRNACPSGWTLKSTPNFLATTCLNTCQNYWSTVLPHWCNALFWKIWASSMNACMPQSNNFQPKKINRRIFQDLPGAGFTGVTRDKFRPPVPAGRDWINDDGGRRFSCRLFTYGHNRHSKAGQDT